MTTASQTSPCPECGADVERGAQFCPHCGTSQPYVAPAHDPFIGRMVSQRFRIERRIARGGMGEVYLARHIELNQSVAVKFLHRRFADDEELAARFFNEARSAVKVKHLLAVTIYDFGRLDDGTLYIVMEFVEGKSLGQILRESGPLHPAVAVRVASQVAEVLASSHGQGVIHRDIKPDNIMIVEGPGGRVSVKVLDFGIAKILDDEVSGGLTQTGMMFGTPEYMSPEQAAGADFDHRVDIYALGLVLYAMLVGHPPFEGQNKLKLLQRHIKEEPPPVGRASRSPLPSMLSELVHETLAKDPNRRPQSMEDFLARIEETRALVGQAPAGGLTADRAMQRRATRPSPPPAKAVDDTPVQSLLPLDFAPEPNESDAFELGDIGRAPATTGFDLGNLRPADDGFVIDDDLPDEEGFTLGDDEFAAPFELDERREMDHGGGNVPVLIALVAAVAVVLGVGWVVLKMGETPDDAAGASDEIASVEDDSEASSGSGLEGSGVASAEGSGTLTPDNVDSDQGAEDETAGESEALAAAEPEPEPEPEAQVDPSIDEGVADARDLLRDGDEDGARARLREIQALAGASDHPGVSELEGDLDNLRILLMEAEAFLREGNCLRADERIVEVKDDISRSIAARYYGQLDECRDAQSAQARAEEPEPEQSAEPARREPEPEPEQSGPGRVRPPREL